MRPRRWEPWPLALGAALAAMIFVCAAFYAVAAAHPDPPVVEMPAHGAEPR
jgi:hypothetical protein